jgi:hypothetical protein
LVGSDDGLVLAGAILDSGRVEDFPCLLFSPAALDLYQSFGKDAQFHYLQELLDDSSHVKLSDKKGFVRGFVIDH